MCISRTYYLLFYPQTQDLTVYRHNGSRYAPIVPDQQGRYPIPELDMEVGLFGGWARYWYQGELLPLPSEMARSLAEERRLRQQAERQRAEAEHQRAEAERQRSEEERQRAE